jgi:hypothetical protein
MRFPSLLFWDLIGPSLFAWILAWHQEMALVTSLDSGSSSAFAVAGRSHAILLTSLPVRFQLRVLFAGVAQRLRVPMRVGQSAAECPRRGERKATCSKNTANHPGTFARTRFTEFLKGKLDDAPMTKGLEHSQHAVQVLVEVAALQRMA